MTLDDVFSYDARSRSIFAKYKPTSHLDKNVESLVKDPFIQEQWKQQQVDVDAIKSEWTSLKTIMSRWDKKDFLPTDWAAVGKKDVGQDNLFPLLDYFLCQNVSSAEAERGFSVLKETKTSKRAILSNFYLSNQMRIILSGT